MRLCIWPQSEGELAQGLALSDVLQAELLSAPFLDKHWKQLAGELQDHNYTHAMLVKDSGVSLLSARGSDGQLFSPLFIDFLSSAWKRRLQQLSARKELAAKALGLHIDKGSHKHIVDACAGFGQDLFVFAALGAKVTAFERSPIAYTLLKDALERANHFSETREIAERVVLHNMDSQKVFHENSFEQVSAIFLDPMFPEKKSSAASKKAMQVFQNIIGEDKDAQDLLLAAIEYMDRSHNCSRVVLKRPKHAPVLATARLGRQEKAKAARLDIYFRQT